jgi:tryptophanyl-tRNA synthetase
MLSTGDRERLLGDLEGGGRAILPEPEVLLTRAPKVPGLDGRKMSKSYDNTIRLREDPASVEKKLKAMQTDPARVRRSDPGDPDKCPVFSLHRIYSTEQTQAWAAHGCRTAGIGCLECKKPLIDSVLAQLAPIRERAREYEANPGRVAEILDAGCARAREAARATMHEVRAAVGLDY